MRAFLAVELPDNVRDALVAFQSRLPVGRPVAAENLHLTLSFLDDQPEERLEELHYELEGLTVRPFDVAFDGWSWFGGARPRLIHAALAANPDLTDLHAAVTRAARRVGIRLERRKYVPHVTLARLGAQAPGDARARLDRLMAELPDPFLPGFTVTGVALYQSNLLPQGARYEVLARYPFM